MFLLEGYTANVHFDLIFFFHLCVTTERERHGRSMKMSRAESSSEFEIVTPIFDIGGILGSMMSLPYSWGSDLETSHRLKLEPVITQTKVNLQSLFIREKKFGLNGI